ncbi:hypothetical protein VTO42DRAFT_1486 [Malbranchea cinnamomea]
MQTKAILAGSLMSASLAAAQVTGALGDAEVVSDNPVGPVYVATLPESDTTSVQGFVAATANNDGEGVVFHVEFFNLPEEGGPFLYHIHDQPVPPDGNCTATLAHLDPFIRGEEPPCDPSAPQTCQVGDLSGKYGDIPNGADEFIESYLDLYASVKPGIGAFFGNRSIVVHLHDKTRIACANFELQGGEDGRPQLPSVPDIPTGTGALRPTSTPTGSPPPFVGGATRTGALSVGAIFAAALALVW